MNNPRLIVFSSGTKDGGGSGFENLVQHSRGADLDANIVAVVSNHEHGGVRSRADRLGIPFVHFPKPWSAERYQKIITAWNVEWVALSGWLKLVTGLDPARTFNIHPVFLSLLGGRFGGAGMYGHYIHEAVAKALECGEIDHSGVSMHFITNEYDRGPVFFEHPVPLTRGMSADDIRAVVNKAEHKWQPEITNLVVHKHICWDGKDPTTLRVPEGYEHLQT